MHINASGQKVTTYFKEGVRVEETLVNALLRLTQEKPKEVYFSQGHGEFQISDQGNQGLSYLAEKLVEQNFVVGGLDLSKEDIPPKTSLFVLWGVKRPFLSNESSLDLNTQNP